MPLELRPMDRADWPRVAELIHHSTNAWYVKNGRPPIFAGPPSVAEVFCRVYEALDPGCCILAWDGEELLGSCFYHPRSTHVSLGIMNSRPESFGRGVARRLLDRILEISRGLGLPVRLVSSATNLDSFSLYNKAGFVPYAVYQDMYFALPTTGLAHTPPRTASVRDATLDDIPAIVALEGELLGIERGGDYRYFLSEGRDIFRMSVLYDAEGLVGFVASVFDPGSHMIGPGAMRSDDAAAALIAHELERYPGRSPVAVVPADRPELTRALYHLGGRNCELHIGQALGTVQKPRGVCLPTFLPETA